MVKKKKCKHIHFVDVFALVTDFRQPCTNTNLFAKKYICTAERKTTTPIQKQTQTSPLLACILEFLTNLLTGADFQCETSQLFHVVPKLNRVVCHKSEVLIFQPEVQRVRESRRRAENKIRDSSEKMTVAFCFYQSIVQRLHSWEANITREEEIAGIYSGDGELNPQVCPPSTVSQPWQLYEGWASSPRIPLAAQLAGEFWDLKSTNRKVVKVEKPWRRIRAGPRVNSSSPLSTNPIQLEFTPRLEFKLQIEFLTSSHILHF